MRLWEMCTGYALIEHRAGQILLLTIMCNKNIARTSCVCSFYYTQNALKSIITIIIIIIIIISFSS